MQIKQSIGTRTRPRLIFALNIIRFCIGNGEKKNIIQNIENRIHELVYGITEEPMKPSTFDNSSGKWKINVFFFIPEYFESCIRVTRNFSKYSNLSNLFTRITFIFLFFSGPLKQLKNLLQVVRRDNVLIDQ